MARPHRILLALMLAASLAACDDSDEGNTPVGDTGDTGNDTGGGDGGLRDTDLGSDTSDDPTPDTTGDTSADVTEDPTPDTTTDLPSEDVADAGDGGGDVSDVNNDADAPPPINWGDDELDPTGGFWSESYIVSGALGDVGAAVYASLIDGDGNLVIGGNFEQVGTAAAANVARWDGTDWSAMGDGLTIMVRDLANGGSGVIYAAGEPGGCIGICGVGGGIGIGGGSNNVYVWNDEAGSWTPEGPGLEGSVWALENVGGDIWVGGYFAEGIAEGTGAPANPANLAILSGGVFEPVSDGAGVVGEVRDIEVGPDGDVCIAGFLEAVDDVEGNVVACWDGETWAAVGDPFPSLIHDLHYDGTNFYAAGMFPGAVAILDEGEWQVLDGGLAGGSVTEVRTLFTNDEGVLYVGGSFDGAVPETGAPVAALNIATYDTEWNDIGGVHNTIGFALYPGPYTFAESSAGVYVGGQFSVAGDQGILNIALYNEDEVEWQAVFDVSKQALGSAGQVLAFAHDADGVVYAGGDFGGMGALSTLNVASLVEGVWTAMGDGLPGVVRALEVDSEGTVWAGGEFIEAGPLGANFLAYYKGETWLAAIGQPNFPVSDISACAGTTIAVSGAFDEISGDASVAAPGLAIYDFEAETWTVPTLPEGWTLAGSAVHCAPDGTIYTAGEVAAEDELDPATRYVMRWDDEGWRRVGSGTTDFVTVNDIDMYGDDLYIAGWLQQLGDIQLGGVARWDGFNWERLGEHGLHTEWDFSAANVVDIDIKSNGLFAIGYFSRSGEAVVNHVAWFDGEEWHSLGDGLNDVGEAVLIFGETVYVGGYFSKTGGIPALGIGQWIYRD